MRKHRLFGVVIAVLIVLGMFTQRSGTPHHTSGTEGAGVPLTTAELSADRVGASVHTTVATDTSYQATQALLDLVAGRAVMILSSPFGAQALVADTHIAQVNEQAVESAYLAGVAQKQAAAKAYLKSMAPPPPPARILPDPWAALRQCESNGNYSDDTGNGYYGAYQFTIGSWRSLGLGGLPSQAPPGQQDQAAQELQARRGWGQWPSCGRRLGLI
jgi:hypothetical protein